MRPTKILKKVFNILIMLTFLVELSACGTLLYPNRRGQTNGRIDPGVAIMDGVCVLLFIVPGVIAFAVDFSTGAIYLPNSSSHRGRHHRYSLSNTGAVRVVHVNPAALNEKTIQKVVSAETGISKTIDLNRAEVLALNGSADVPLKLAEMEKSDYRIDKHNEK